MHNLRNKAYTLLRSSESFFKTDMVYLTKGGFWLVLGYVIQALSGLVLSIAFANLLPKEIYGNYRYIMSVANILGIFTLSGMSTAVTRAVARGSDSALQTGFRTQMVWSTAIVLASAAVAAYYYTQDNMVLASSFLIVGAFTPFIKAFGLSQAFLLGKKLFKESTMLGLWRKFLPVIAMLITLLLTKNPVILVFVFFASNALSSGMLYLMTVRKYPAPRQTDPELISYSKHLSVMKTIGNAVANLDQVLIFQLLGATPLAIYALAWVPIKHIETLFFTFKTLAFPKLSTKNFSDIKKTLHHKVVMATLLMLVTAIVYIIAAPFLFKLLFPTYNESVRLSQVMALSLFALPRTLYVQALEAHKMNRELYILRISTPAVSLVLLMTLIPSYGVWGAIYAMLGTHIYGTILTGFLFYKNRHETV